MGQQPRALSELEGEARPISQIETPGELKECPGRGPGRRPVLRSVAAPSTLAERDNRPCAEREVSYRGRFWDGVISEEPGN